ncbi:MAG: hypothetical protein V7742_21185 [Halioglobus sp.]
MDYFIPPPRRHDDGHERADEILALIEQSKRIAKKLIAAALVLGLLLGFGAGLYFEEKLHGQTRFIVKDGVGERATGGR